MIMADWQIKNWAESGGIRPFNPDMVNPASIDLRWSGRGIYLGGYEHWEVEEPRMIIYGETLLLDTLEVIKMPSIWCGFVTLKSSVGRRGISITHTGLVDPGFEGTLTITLKIAENVVIEPRQPLFQMWLERLERPPHDLYNGKYQGQSAPERAR